jgi:alkylation response protein AidB-like acyl-CoA dehydrogenase
VDFAFSPEQDELRHAAREMLADRYPLERIAALADSAAGWDPASWRQLAEQGWLGLSVPEAQGGLGLTTLDEAVLFEEAGRALYPGPFFSTVALCLPLLLAAGATGADLVKAIAAGGRSATLAWAEGRGDSITAGDLATTADAGTVAGTKRFVPDVAAVTDVLVTARGSEGIEVHAVDLSLNDPRVTVEPSSTTDTTRRLGQLRLDSAPARRLLAGPAAEEALAATRLRALAAVALEAVGVAGRCLELAAAHAAEREQFGRPIGAYQAVSHRVADIFMATELARSLAYWAAWAVDAGATQAPLAAPAAKAAAAEAAVLAAESALQVHGGIGMTWEHPLHRLYKRAQALAAFDGPPPRQRALVAAALLDS